LLGRYDLHFGAKRCSAHSDVAGYRYAGYNGCCQYYVAGVRQDLIALAAFASRHSRAHTAYVAEVDRFDMELTTLYARYGGFTAYPGFAPLGRPVKPVNNMYVPFTFRDWLIRMATNNNTPEILALTDQDDPVMMTDKVYISGRYSTCGHSAPASYQYTSWNWCGHHHYTRALKKETFEIAHALIIAQRAHLQYVQTATVFEAQAKAVIMHYWNFFNGRIFGSGLVTVGGTVALAADRLTSVGQIGANPEASTHYQSLRSNRGQLRDCLTDAMKTLELAAGCRTLASEINETGGKVCTDSARYGDELEKLKTELNLAGYMLSKEKRELEDKVETYSTAHENLRKEKEALEEKVRILETGGRDANWQKHLDEVNARIQEMERKKMEEEVVRKMRYLDEKMEADRDRVSLFLGKVMWTLNREQKDDDLDKFQGIPTVEKLLTRADTILLSRVRQIAGSAD
jgi:hypothetical protein